MTAFSRSAVPARIAVLLLAMLAVSTAIAQSRPAPVIATADESYSPDDPWHRGKRYQIETGHFGKYYNCDCEESKRNSPWIHWPSVHRCETQRIGWRVLRHDVEEVQARVRNGRCCPNCWPDWLCPGCQTSCDCSGPCGIGTNQALIMAQLPAPRRRMAVEQEEHAPPATSTSPSSPAPARRDSGRPPLEDGAPAGVQPMEQPAAPGSGSGRNAPSPAAPDSWNWGHHQTGQAGSSRAAANGRSGLLR